MKSYPIIWRDLLSKILKSSLQRVCWPKLETETSCIRSSTVQILATNSLLSGSCLLTYITWLFDWYFYVIWYCEYTKLVDQGNDDGFLSEPKFLSLLQSAYASYLVDTRSSSAGAQKAHHPKLAALFHIPRKLRNFWSIPPLVGPGDRAV